MLNYLSSDYQSSTYIIADANGNRSPELRCKAWGEVRYAAGVMPARYTYTGQYSYTESFGLMFYNARWYDPALGRFAQGDTIVPDPYNTQSWGRFAYAYNSPVRYNDPSGHKVCSGILSTECVPTHVSYWRAKIAKDFGIIMSNSGGKKWDLKNLMLIYDSLQNIDSVALNGQMKAILTNTSATFKLTEYKGSGAYYGITYGTTIVFFTKGKAPICQMNVYHEFGHLLDNIPGMRDVFSVALANLRDPSFITNKGFLDREALVNPYRIFGDPNYPSVEVLQHPSSDPTEIWADIFSNYVAGNIRMDIPIGVEMYEFVTGILTLLW